MPYIRLEVIEGVTRDQKATVVQEFTETLQRVLGKRPEHVHIVIDEVREENWGYHGMLTDDWRRRGPPKE